jgi:hypothetical protein
MWTTPGITHNENFLMQVLVQCTPVLVPGTCNQFCCTPSSTQYSYTPVNITATVSTLFSTFCRCVRVCHSSTAMDTRS